MGIFRKLNERGRAKIEAARQQAHDDAIASGRSEVEAQAAGDEAARRRRRRRSAILGANGSGGA